MESFAPENSKDKLPAEKKILRTNPAQLMAIGFMKRDQIAGEAYALSREPKMAKVPLRNPPLVGTPRPSVSKSRHCGNVETKYPNLSYVTETRSGFYKKGDTPRTSISSVTEVDNEDDAQADKETEIDDKLL